MTCSAIICDWNGTLFEDIDDEAIARAITAALAKSYVPWHPFKLARLIKTRKELEALNNQRNESREEDRVIEIFRIFSENIINGVPMSLVCRFVERYAKRREVQDKVIYKALRPIAEFHQAGVTTGILSAGYNYGIEMILKSAGYGGCFDFCEANLLAETGNKATGFTLNIYKNKADLLLRIIKERELDPKRTAYMGDSLDDTGCFEVIGHPIVSFLTPEGLKQSFAQKYGVFIPEDESDLTKYLQSI